MNGAYWSFDLSPMRIAAAALLLLGTVAISIVQYRRGGRRRIEFVTEAIRFLAVALVAVTLLRPERVRAPREESRPALAVLLDRSGSMATPDVAAPDGEGRITRAAWVEPLRDAAAWAELADRFDIRIEEFGAPAADSKGESEDSEPTAAETEGLPAPPARDAAAAQPGTDMHAPLEEWARRPGAARAVLMMGDGDWNAGPSPVEAATRLRASGTPVFTVTTGADTFLPDIELVSVRAPAYAQVDELVHLPFVLNSRMPGPAEVTLRLLENGVERARRVVPLPAMAQVASTLAFQPDREGEHSFVLRADLVDGETREDNNERGFVMALRREIIRVLILETEPRWEYRYLRNAAMRDPGVEVHTILFHPGMSPGSGLGYLPEFPRSREELSSYDVVFIGDVAMGEGGLSEEQCGWIRDLVRSQAGGLVWLPGPMGRWTSLATGPLGELLPVELDADHPRGFGMARDGQLALTMRGRDHRLTRLAATPEANELLWSRLPGFHWYAGVSRAHPGADVLAVHAQAHNADGRIPLIVARQEGSGKVLFMGHDSAWRWRRGVEDLHHYRFWVQVFRWMAHQRHLVQAEGLRFFYTPESPASGDRLWLQATPLDLQGFPLEGATVEGVLTSPSGVAVPIAFRPVPDGWGAYQGDAALQEGGEHIVLVRCRETGKSAEVTVHVATPDPEPIGRPARPEVMREISSVTGGRSVGVGDWERMKEWLRELPPRPPRETRFRLWCHPLWLTLLSAGLGAYWVLRKLLGRI